MITREATGTLLTHAGPEIGVASTKAFTCQLTVLLSLAIAAGRARGTLSAEEEKELVNALIAIPGQVTEAMKREHQIEILARDLSKAKVTFTVKKFTGAVLTTTQPIQADASGNAATTASVPTSDDPYTVEVQVDPRLVEFDVFRRQQAE